MGVVTVAAVSAVVVSAAAGSAGGRAITDPRVMPDTTPTRATSAFATRSGSASRRATAGESAGSRSASNASPVAGHDPLSTAIPDLADRGLGPARAEAAAGPAPAIKARAAVPVGPRSVLCLFPFDPFGGAVAGQKAVAVPAARHMALRRRRRRKDCRGRQQHGCNRNKTGEVW